MFELFLYYELIGTDLYLSVEWPKIMKDLRLI